MKSSPMPIRHFTIGIYDGPHATPKPSNEGPIFLGIKNVTQDGRLDFGEIRHVSEAEFPKWTRRVRPQKDDIIFSYEATLHRYALIPEGFEGCLGRRMALVRPDRKKVDPRFLHYYFLSPVWHAKMDAITITGATVNRIPLTSFPDTRVSFPKLNKQVTIASILSAYDDLIENNRRRIALLEEAARLLYREWFVHFRFPGHEHVKFVDGIPEGWERRTLADIAQTNRDSYRAKELPEELNYIDISSVAQGRILSKNRVASTEAPGRARRKARDGDVIWSNVRPNLRAYALVLEPNQNDVFSTGFTVLSATEVPFTWLYLLVTTDRFVGHLVNHATGAGYPAVRPDDFERATVAFPRKAVLNLFHKSTEPKFRLISKLEKQNQKLAQARDLLLPRLMSGEVKV
ncbi:MAG: restriction endonuclease subunit S [Acidobacteriota bacterium]|nr:restriction endonuclease subunit S [Acidobacteriota bacterium]